MPRVAAFTTSISGEAPPYLLLMHHQTFAATTGRMGTHSNSTLQEVINRYLAPWPLSPPTHPTYLLLDSPDLLFVWTEKWNQRKHTASASYLVNMHYMSLLALPKLYDPPLQSLSCLSTDTARQLCTNSACSRDCSILTMDAGFWFSDGTFAFRGFWYPCACTKCSEICQH